MPLNNSNLCFMFCAFELVLCCLLCFVPSVLQAFGLCFKRLCFGHFVLQPFE
jgi:hypothetical protein